MWRIDFDLESEEEEEEEEKEEKEEGESNFEFADYFCGIGGFSAGAQQAGAVPVLGIDRDPTVLRVWAANNPRAVALCDDVFETNIPWPPNLNVHIHMSPPCTALSKVRPNTPLNERLMGLSEMRWCINEIIRRGYHSFSIENVSTALTRALCKEFKVKYPMRLDYSIFNSNTFGSPSDRQRLIVSSPSIIKRLKEFPVHRTSVQAAFQKAKMHLPADYIKGHCRKRTGEPCIRPCSQTAPTLVASHPLVWCTREGVTIRCLSPLESKLLLGVPMSWEIPNGQRNGIKAVGNALSPGLAECIMAASVATFRERGRGTRVDVTNC